MQTISAQKNNTTFPRLLIANLLGMGIVALCNPLIYYSQSPVVDWMATIVSALAVAGIAYGLLALISKEKARKNWPAGFFKICWVVLALLVAEPWISKMKSPSSVPATASPNSSTSIDWEKGVLTPPSSH